MHKLVRLVLFSVSVTTVFARNDTILYGWHSESHERGTWSILWGCLATIFICTWSVLHLEVPPRSHNDLARFTRKVAGTLFAIIGPEWSLAEAIDETLTSRILRKRLNGHVDRQQGREAWSLTHVRFMLDEGFVKDTETNDVWDPTAQPEEVSIIPQEPPISKQELNSRSTTDWIANTLAVLQISWFGAQLLVRRIQHLHITAMEILTLAFIVCSIVTFGFCWPEPQNVAYPIVLRSLEHSPPDGPRALDRSEEVQNRAPSLSESLDGTHIISFLLLAFAGGIFGGVHCLAWNSTFPTPKERLAWRVCCVATTALPVVCSTAYLPDWFADKYVAIFLLILYIIARLTIIALALASLRAVPADVFQTTDWSNIIPHIGF